MSVSANHLAGERSLYLRMHAENPVDWYPWGREAFEKARSEDKPLFLSIGYSACHWCHVMARESFEDENVASLLNHGFVSVKVDREERPDVDSIYMAACQLMTGSGGWPLTLLLTPDLRPFFAGSYMPRTRSPAGPGLIEIMTELDSQWRFSRSELVEYSQKVEAALKEFATRRGRAPIRGDPAADALRSLSVSFDEENGGFEVAPKFPSPHRLLLLLRIHEVMKDEKALAMVVRTLDALRAGGIYDHVGSGFHRYSTDRRWHLPHFEKMLYDQAMHVLAYAEAFRATGDQRYKRTALDVIDFVTREMTSPGGGFYSAIGAESEGEEGRYYLWSVEEVRRILDPKEADIMIESFGLTQEGNYREEATGRRTGRNVLHLVRSVDEMSRTRGIARGEVESTLRASLAMLSEVRKRRPRPALDDKILTDWNGMMIAASARAGRLLDSPEAIESARRALVHIERMMGTGGDLRHRIVGDEVAVDGMLDDYACLAWGSIELANATDDRSFASMAEELVGRTVERFREPESGAFYQTSKDAEHLIARMCEGYDGASPSGNSTVAYVLGSLSKMTGKAEHTRLGLEAVEAFSDDVRENPAAHTFLILALMNLGRTDL
ncbi:MAG: thioredoxin domain-containing protein [Methanomassiliicoccales archaeon]|nr:thioredoxin domain-containing protein [Methanomassiliicoccales archaeon]